MMDFDLAQIMGSLESLGGLGQVTKIGEDYATSKQFNYQAVMMDQSSSLKLQGAQATARALRASAKNLESAFTFNQGVEDFNLQRRLRNVAIENNRLIGRQTAQLAAQNVSGKTALLLRNEAANSFQQQVLETKIDRENSRRAAEFEKNVAKVNLENEARITDWQGQVQKALSDHEASKVRRKGKDAKQKSLFGALELGATIIGSL